MPNMSREPSLLWDKLPTTSPDDKIKIVQGGRVISVKLGDIMAEIVMQVGENTITSVITRGSAESMELKVGDEVTALIKSTEVMLLK